MNWRKSSRSPDNNYCVEAAPGQAVAVRDSKNPAAGHLAISRRKWGIFTAALRSGKI